MWNWLKNLFGVVETTAGDELRDILSVFHTAHDSLNTFVNRANTAGHDLLQEAAALEKKAEDFFTHANHAAAVRDQIIKPVITVTPVDAPTPTGDSAAG